MKLAWILALTLLALPLRAQEEHDHPVPEKLGSVSFPTSCNPAVQQRFERAVALLHSFAYSASEQAFREVAQADPKCAMAYWGVAMTYYHQLWEPWITPANLERGEAELAKTKTLVASEREQQYVAAISSYFRDYERVPPRVRAKAYADAMAELASKYPSDSEAQVFYALALLGTATPLDKTHSNQKHAAEILEPLYQKQPQHPGIAHYLIHSYDSAELATRGLPAARAYSKIAPSAPHALHMPSHIFTRLGLWDDSISSNLAARAAAHQQGDRGEELHAMDYLTYAYLQRGRNEEAAQLLEDLKGMRNSEARDFKIGYAATAMPVRYAVERRQWIEAANLQPVPGATPQVAAISYWARAISLARSGKADGAASEIAKLKECLQQVNNSGNSYWAAQVRIQLLEAQAWLANAQGKPDEAVSLLRSAADEEDGIEKLPLTPGPIVPAREQLADLLLTQSRAKEALTEFEASLLSTPGRRGALVGAARSAEILGDNQKAQQLRAALD